VGVIERTEGDGITLCNDALHSPCTDNVPKRRLSPLNERLSQVRNPKGRTVRIGDLEVNDRVNFDIDVVARDNRLSANRRNLNLHVDDTE
jgi:hypothetical protein